MASRSIVPETSIVSSVHLQELTDQASPSPATLITEPDNELLQAVEENDVGKLKDIFAKRQKVDVNFINASGQTLLQIAVNNRSTEIIQILLENGADIGNALIQAVSEESLECVKILFEFQELRSDYSTSSDSNNAYRATPLILAAKNNSHDIVKFLVSKGHYIDDRDLHNRACECTKCESEGRLGCSLRRLNVYQGLASPTYLSLTYLSSPVDWTLGKQDPIIRAFILNKQLLSLSKTEYELKDEYLALAEQCEDFAVRLLEECRNMSEIEQLMNVPMLEEMQYVKILGRDDISKKLSVLNFAIKNDNRKFVAHSYSQMMLNSVLYKGFRKWENYGAIRKITLSILYTILLPFWSFLFIFFPEHRWSKLLSTPLVKFVAHTGSFCIFLLLLFLSAIQDRFDNPLRVSFLDCLLIIWITGLAVEEVKVIIRQGRKRYLSQFWNIVTLLMLLLFFISAALWISGYAMSKETSWAISLKKALGLSEDALKSYRVILISNSCFAVGYILAFLHISNALQVNSVMGPLQLSLIKMVRDILKFFFLFFLIYAAFTMSIRKVYSQYVWAKSSMVGNHTLQGDGFASVHGSMRLMFWAMFDKTELSRFETKSFPSKITQNTGEFLFTLFNIATGLVAFNMLIATMCNSFQSIEDNSDIHWKFSRTQMWMQFIDKGSVLPPPFNIVPNVTDFLHLFRLLFTKWCKCCPQCNCGDRGMDVFLSQCHNNDSYQREKLINHLVQRHFYHLTKERDAGKTSEYASHKEEELNALTSRLEKFMAKLEEKTRQRRQTAEQDVEVEELLKSLEEIERENVIELTRKVAFNRLVV